MVSEGATGDMEEAMVEATAAMEEAMEVVHMGLETMAMDQLVEITMILDQPKRLSL